MVAPAIVLAALGDEDPTTGQSLAPIVEQLTQVRPDLAVRLGLHGASSPTVTESTNELVKAGHTEIVLIPLDLVSASDDSPLAKALQTKLLAENQLAQVRISRPIGPATELLNILDNRVREALHQANAVEVDALVLAAPEGGDLRGSSLLARRTRQWGAHHKLPVQLAVNDLSGQATATAVANLRTQGRRHIAVGSLFLTQTPTYRAHQQAALQTGALAVTSPIGPEPRLAELILARYAFAAMELLDSAPATTVSEQSDAE